MNSADLRQSFLDFFHEKEHSIVPSAPLMPTAPNLLFTNAGMNQFVPYFLGEQAPAASKLPGVTQAALDTRAADTQKCIRAGGKHNDLEDVGFDTYHHTMFEMLGNWSFGDYFKKEAIEWAWELLTQRWGMPKERLYASVYKPEEGDPAEFDQEAYDYWKAIFEKEGLDPETHIVYGNKKDNFWMMGDTGPCGPCSEVHIDLTPEGDTQGKLVNADSPWCIEIWNLVFIQFNANEDGTFKPLAAKHVDTGMGFERVAGMMATSNGFKDFSKPPSNYNSDLFTDLFAAIGKLSNRTYGYTMPENPEKLSDQELNDVVFRILADHIRTLSFSIADGILPGNDGRNYVLRRILRRAVMWGKRIDLPSGFFAQLVDPLIEKMGTFFPELVQQREVIKKVIANEESAFDKTLGKGLEILNDTINSTWQQHIRIRLDKNNSNLPPFPKDIITIAHDTLDNLEKSIIDIPDQLIELFSDSPLSISGEKAFQLYDTYGFPLDLTQLIARERGLTVDLEGFETCMQEQRERARAAQKKSVVVAKDASGEAAEPTEFVGFESLKHHETEFLQTIKTDDKVFAVFASTPFYAEMGGQVGDRGVAEFSGKRIQIVDTIKDAHGRFLHEVSEQTASELDGLNAGDPALLSVNVFRRAAIQRHHTATHMLHWALRKVVGEHVRQAGSLVDDKRLRFDFNHFEALTQQQIDSIEMLINQYLLDNYPVRWYEVPMADKPEDVIAFFGDKYGDKVRVVEIGGEVFLKQEMAGKRSLTYTPKLCTRKPALSAELCGGTHVSATGEIGLFKITSESAVAAGTRRIEAVCGELAYRYVNNKLAKAESVAQSLKCQLDALPERVSALVEKNASLEKELRAVQQKGAAAAAGDLANNAVEKDGAKWIVSVASANNPNDLRGMAVQIAQKFDGPVVVVLGADMGKKVSVLALCNDAAVAAGHNAGNTLRTIAEQLGGKGGGKPDFAMGGAPNNGNLKDVLESFLKG